jgi:hypothetical protein
MAKKNQLDFHRRARSLIPNANAAFLLAELGNFWQVSKIYGQGRMWIVGTAEEYSMRCGLTLDAYKRAFALLKARELVVVIHGPHTFRSGILRATWVSIPDDVVAKLGLRVPLALKKAKSATQSFQASMHGVGGSAHTYTKEEEVKEKVEKGESLPPLSPFQEEPSGKMESVENTDLGKLYEVWRDAYVRHGHGHCQQWTQKEVTKFASRILAEAHGDMSKLAQAIDVTFMKWGGFTIAVRDGKGWKQNIPHKPSLAFVSMTIGLMYDYAKEMQKEIEYENLNKWIKQASIQERVDYWFSPTRREHMTQGELWTGLKYDDQRQMCALIDERVKAQSSPQHL